MQKLISAPGTSHLATPKLFDVEGEVHTKVHLRSLHNAVHVVQVALVSPPPRWYVGSKSTSRDFQVPSLIAVYLLARVARSQEPIAKLSKKPPSKQRCGVRSNKQHLGGGRGRVHLTRNRPQESVGRDIPLINNSSAWKRPRERGSRSTIPPIPRQKHDMEQHTPTHDTDMYDAALQPPAAAMIP
jgi:hypothetical protein